MDDLSEGLAATTEMGILYPSTIPSPSMDENADHLKTLMQGAGITRAEAAEKLHMGIETIHKWLKPDTTKSAVRCPRWAVELLAYKTRQRIPPIAGGTDAEDDIGARVAEMRAQKLSFDEIANRLKMSRADVAQAYAELLEEQIQSDAPAKKVAKKRGAE